jgi:hypothetical protein
MNTESLDRFYYAYLGVQAGHFSLLPTTRLERVQSLARQRRNELVNTIDLTIDKDERDLLSMQAIAAGSRADGATVVLRANGYYGGVYERDEIADASSLVRYYAIVTQEVSSEMKG